MKYSLLFLLLTLSINLFSQLTYVPDDNFEQALIDLGYDDVLDDYVLTSNISGINSLIVGNKNISDLTGIEDFVSLTELSCINNQLTSINVTQNTSLINLYCHDNNLSELDITQNSDLSNLVCHSNILTSLDVTQNINLTHLSCYNNPLANLNISQNTALTELWCYSNELTNLDITQNTALTKLHCERNHLTALDVSQNTALTSLYCRINDLTNIDVSQNTALTFLSFSENSLTSLDVSSNTALTALYCFDNQLTSLDVRNGNNTILIDFYAEDNPNLTCIFVDNAGWSEINWTNIDPASTFVETEAECDALNLIEISKNKQISIFPNPSKGSFQIKSDYNIKNVLIYDLTGNLIRLFEMQESYSTENFSKGLYFIEIKTNDQSSTMKLIIE